MYLIDYLCMFVEELIVISINSVEINNLFLSQITKKLMLNTTHIIDKTKFSPI
jgi:hypothetical protein